MSDISRRTFTSGLGASVVAGAAAMGSPLIAQPIRSRNFKVYAALLHAGEPDLRPFGIDPIYLFDRGVWAEGVSRNDAPDPELIAQRLAKFPDDGSPVVMDFEFFKFRNPQEAAASRRSLSLIADSFQRGSGSRPIGFYEYLPRRNFWSAIEPCKSDKYRNWQGINDFFAPLERQVDIIFPSIYTFHDNPRRWITYAKAQVREARRLSDKPVIPFIWPDFHYNGKDGPLVPIPADFWRLQMETLAEIADGFTIWGGWDPVKRSRVQWDDRAPWWIETRRFLRNNGLV